MKKETIAAIATGLSNAGISIIRISGDEAFDIIDKIYKSKSGKKILSKEESHTIHYGFIVDDNEIADEVMVAIMRAPSTYTREDSVEIYCHGGIVVTKKILNIVIKNGARIAEPGEFTKRAFLNGRIDLSKAEAVSDIINAKNEQALKNSINQLRGKEYEIIKEIRENILVDMAFIEAALDDPENYRLEGFSNKLDLNIKEEFNKIEKLLLDSENGRIIKEGIRTVIVGKPNVGKSSLLNYLLGEDRAIVTDIPGTTRDTLEEYINLDGITLNIIDTAGIRDTDDEVEKIGVEKSKKYINEADLVMYVIDSSTNLDENDQIIFEMIKDKKTIILLNKSDLKALVNEDDIKKKSDHRVVSISVKENRGLSGIEENIKDMFFNGEIDFNEDVYITNERHKEALSEALDSLKSVQESINSNMPEDFFTIDLMDAYEALGRIIGENVEEDLVNKIFSEFCMGK